MSERRLLISFSGGETSAFMTNWLLKPENVVCYDRVVVVFANTGEENEATLLFIHKCDEVFNFNTVWIEGVQYQDERRSPGFRIVTFATADRKGGPFEDSIRKYGIPNKKYPDCTRNLKRRPIEAYASSIGWEGGSYDLAIGIRIDEIDRMSVEAKTRRLRYPLISDIPMSKPDVNRWWAAQPFRLELAGWQGNCKWCWKKSLRKHLTIMDNNPAAFDFPRRMELEYGSTGPEHGKMPPGYRRKFFRENRSVADIEKILALKKSNRSFVPAKDDTTVHDLELDLGGGCAESCEVFSDEDDE